MLQDLLTATEIADLRPPVDATFAFADAPAAYTHLASGPFGKVMITLP